MILLAFLFFRPVLPEAVPVLPAPEPADSSISSSEFPVSRTYDYSIRHTYYKRVISLNSKMMVKNWKEYEWGVVKILFEEIGDFTLRYNVNIVGKSGQSRQIDLVSKPGYVNLVSKVYDRRSREFEIIDCKERSRPTDINDVEQFIGLVADTGARKGTIISSSGFTVGAKRRAEVEDRIELRKIASEESNTAISGEIYPNYIAEQCGACIDQRSDGNRYGRILWYGNWQKVIGGKAHICWVGKCLTCEKMQLYCDPCGATNHMEDNRGICPVCRIYYTSFRKISGTDEKPGRMKYKPKAKYNYKKKIKKRRNESIHKYF